MKNETIKIYSTIEDSEDYLEGKEFFGDTVPKALRACLEKGYVPAFMPRLIDTRIHSTKESKIWLSNWNTLSIQVTRRGKPSNISKKGGTSLTVFAHVPNYFSNPDNLERAIAKIANGAGIFPEEEFQRLLGLVDDQNVFLRELSVLKKWPGEIYGIDKPTDGHMKNYGGKIGGVEMIAINHPKTIPYFGGKERAQRYLESHMHNIADVICIWNLDDIFEKPLARLLTISFDFDYGIGDDVLNSYGRFVGMPGSGTAPEK